MKKIVSLLAIGLFLTTSVFSQTASRYRIKNTPAYSWPARTVPTAAYMDSTLAAMWNKNDDGLPTVRLTPTTVKTANYTVAVNNFVPVDISSGSFTLTLPSAPTDGSGMGMKVVAIASTNSIVIKAGGSDVFNVAAGSTSLTLQILNQGVILQYKSSTGIWYVMSNDRPFTTSAQLSTLLSDETGSGALVFGTSPTLVTPTIGVASATSLNKVVVTQPTTSSTLTLADGKSLTQSNSLTWQGVDGSTVDYSNGGSINYRTNYNRNFIRDWDAQIAKIQQATTSSTASIIWIGDSWTTNGNIVQPIASYLRTKFGDAGVGYFGAGSGNQGNSSGSDGQSATITRVGTWTNVSQNTYVMSAAIAADSSSTLSDSIYYVGRFTDVVVHYMKKASGGSFVTRIDGTSPTTVSTSGTTGLNFSSITGLTDGTHTISIKVSTAGNGVLICGAELNRNQNGVRVHNLGCSGSTATEWVRQDATNWQSAVTELAPNMACIMLGVNDCAQNMTTTTYTNNLQTIVNRILTSLPNCAIVLVNPSDIGLATTYPMSDYNAAAKSFALINNYGYIDNYSLIGVYSTANTRGLYTNTSHVNATGGQVIGENFKNWLMNGQSMYYNNGNNLALGESNLLNAAASGSFNIAIGYQVLKATTTGSANVGTGYQSLLANTTGQGNTAYGYNTLKATTTVSGSSAFGWNALASSTSGVDNSAFGEYALKSNTTGARNSAFGRYVLNLNTSGADNTAMGRYSLYNCASGSNNVAIGSSASQANTGSYNTVIGTSAAATSGSVNGISALGYAAMGSTTGGNHTAMGYLAGYNTSTGTGCIYVGYQAGRYMTTEINRLIIGSGDQANKASDTTKSIIYGYIHATTANQRLYFNADEYVAGKSTITGALSVASTATISGNAVTSTTLSGALLATSLTGSATLDFSSTAAGAVTDLTLTVTGAADGDPVTIGVPNASIPAGGTFYGWVSAANVVTIRYANNSLVTTYDPTSGTFKAKVWKN